MRVVILPSPIPNTTDLAQESTAFFIKLFQTFHLLLSPFLSDQPGYKGKEKRIGGQDTCTLKLAINFPSFRLKALIVFRPLKIYYSRKSLIDKEPVVVKDKLVCLIEDCKNIKDSFRHLHERVD